MPFDPKNPGDGIMFYLRGVYVHLSTGHSMPDLGDGKGVDAIMNIRELFPAAWPEAEAMNAQELAKAINALLAEQDHRRAYLAERERRRVYLAEHGSHVYLAEEAHRRAELVVQERRRAYLATIMELVLVE